jgi:type IV pilus assembly protein PilN
MKIPINLASQPFRRDRPMLVGSALVAFLLAGTLAVLISLVLMDRAQSADVRRDLARLEAAIRQTQAQQAALETVLRKPENAEVLERSVFLNGLLYRKGISWTKIFSDLGHALPANVRIMTIRPFVNKDNKVTLDMTVGAMTPGAVIELLKALESSPLFESVSAPNSLAPSQAEPLYRARLTVNYAQKL